MGHGGDRAASRDRQAMRRPIGLSAKEVIEWYTVVDEVTGCWEWQAFKHKGYGKVGFEGKCWRAHRLAYVAWVGPIPEDLVLDHFVCDNCGCANPEHVRPVTHLENSLRSDTSLGAVNTAKTHCPYGHPYAGANLAKNGSQRACRVCKVKRSTAINRRNGCLPRALLTHCKRGHPYAGANVYTTKRGRWCVTCRNLLKQRYRAKKAGFVELWPRMRDALAYRARLHELAR